MCCHLQPGDVNKKGKKESGKTEITTQRPLVELTGSCVNLAMALDSGSGGGGAGGACCRALASACLAEAKERVQDNGCCPLQQLPRELLTCICGFLDAPQLLALALVSRLVG